MKINLFKDKDGNLHSWASGNASYAVVISNKLTGESYEASQEVIDLPENEALQLHSTDYDLALINGVPTVTETLASLARKDKTQKRSDLKKKIDGGTFSNADIKDALKLLLE